MSHHTSTLAWLSLQQYKCFNFANVHSMYSNRVRPFLFLIVSAIVVLFEAEVGPEHLWVINGRYIKSVQYPPPYSWLPATSRIAKAISDCHIHLRLQTIAQIVLFIITSSSSNHMLCLPFMSLKRHCCLFIFFQCVLWHLDIWTSVFVAQNPQSIKYSPLST